MKIFTQIPSDQRLWFALSIVLVAFFLLYVTKKLHDRWSVGPLKSRYYLFNSFVEELFWPAVFSILLFSFHLLSEIVYMNVQEHTSNFIFRLSWKAFFEMKTFFVVIWLAWFALGLVNFFEKYLIYIHFFKRLHLHIIGKLLRLSTLSLIFLIALPFFGVDTSRFLFFGGGSALIFGLAIQPLMRNYLGGLMIYMDHIFEEGHQIRVKSKNIAGHVTRIGWRSTRIEDEDGGILYIPNDFFASVSVLNLSKQRIRRFEQILTIGWEARKKSPQLLEKIKEFFLKEKGIATGNPPIIEWMGSNKEGIKLAIVYYTNTTQLIQQNKIWGRIFIAIVDLLEEENIPLYGSEKKIEPKQKN